MTGGSLLYIQVHWFKDTEPWSTDATVFSFLPCSARDAIFLGDRLDSPYSAWQSYSVLPQRFFPQILSSSAPATITADLAAEEGNTAVPRHDKYYPATVRGIRQPLSGCSQLHPGQVRHQITLHYSSGPTDSCLVMKTRNCLFAFFHKTNHPLLAPTLSCEVASVLS